METIRDTTFGKIMRFFTGNRLLRYPEEKDISRYIAHIIKSPPEVSEEDIGLNMASSEGYGLYSIMSQVSSVRTTRSIPPEETGVTLTQTQGETKIVGWRGTDDPENPQNWSVTKKLCTSLLIWLLTFAIYIGSSIYTPGIPGVSQQFGVNNVASTLGLTLFVAGYGLGPMVWSPLSEIPMIGRSPTYVLTLFVFVFFQFAVIYATNFGMLLAFRFLTGFVGSPALATGGASMGDIWSPQSRDYMIGMWGCFAVAAPVLGPLVGGFAFSAKGWTWTIWQLLWVSGFSLVLLFFFLPETFGPNILSRRARRFRRITGDQSFLSEAEREIRAVKPADVLFEALVRPFVICFSEPIVFLLNLYISLIYGILYMWFEAFPIVFGEIHGFNPGETGLAFLGIIVGTVGIAIPGYFWWKYKYQSKLFDAEGNIAPEAHLPPACVGSFCLPISLFWFGWTGNFEHVHWIVPIIASVLFAVGAVLIFNSVFCYLAYAYARYAASALAGNDFMRSSFGAGFPLFATAMFHNLTVGWACSLLGFLTVAFVPYPFLLYIWGKKIRMKSKYARHDI